jgi:hypothetical protein
MRYLVEWEYDPKNVKAITEASIKMQEERKKNPEKYTKLIFPNHVFLGETKGFAIIEGTKEQIWDWVLSAKGMLKYKLKPIVPDTEAVEAVKKVYEIE